VAGQTFPKQIIIRKCDVLCTKPRQRSEQKETFHCQVTNGLLSLSLNISFCMAQQQGYFWKNVVGLKFQAASDHKPVVKCLVEQSNLSLLEDVLIHTISAFIVETIWIYKLQEIRDYCDVNCCLRKLDRGFTLW